jgi:hypothetical protein
MALRVLGVDPGGTTGMALLELSREDGGRHALYTPYTTITHTLYQYASIEAARGALEALKPDLIAVESWVAMRRAGRLSGYRKGGRIAADLAAEVGALGEGPSTASAKALLMAGEPIDGSPYVVSNNAARAKKWATDRRLAAAGIRGRKTADRHALDGARHALFAATELGLIEDPLMVQARRAQRRRTLDAIEAHAQLYSDQVQLYRDSGATVTEFGPGAMFDTVIVDLPTEPIPVVGTPVHEAMENFGYTTLHTGGLVNKERDRGQA